MVAEEKPLEPHGRKRVCGVESGAGGRALEDHRRHSKERCALGQETREPDTLEHCSAGRKGEITEVASI